MSETEHQRGRATARIVHESDTKTTRFLHGFYTVFSTLPNPNHGLRQHLRRREKLIFARRPPSLPSAQ